MRTNFIELFKMLSLSEQDAFGNYFQCFYSKHVLAARALEFIRSSLGSGSGINVESPVLYRHVFEREHQTPKDIKNIQNILADLKKWLLEFLMWQEVKNCSELPESQIILLGALRRRGLFKVYQQQAIKAFKYGQEHSSKSMWDYEAKLRIFHHIYFHASENNLFDRHDELDSLLKKLDLFYWSARLKYACEQYSRSSILEEAPPSLDVNELIEKTTTLFLERNEQPCVYLDLLKLITTGDERLFGNLKNRLLTGSIPDLHDQEATIKYLLNHTAKAIRSGKEGYMQESFDLYKIGLEKNIFTENGWFPAEPFQNIVNLASALQEFEWVNDFISRWGRFIEPAEQADTIGLCKARVMFAEKKFEEAISLLNPVRHRNIAYSLHARTLLIRCYYEIGAPGELINHNCNSFYLYVRRSRLIGLDLKNSAFKFIKVIRGLVKNKPKRKLLELLDTEDPVFSKSWLFTQIEHLPDRR